MSIFTSDLLGCPARRPIHYTCIRALRQDFRPESACIVDNANVTREFYMGQAERPDTLEDFKADLVRSLKTSRCLLAKTTTDGQSWEAALSDQPEDTYR